MAAPADQKQIGSDADGAENAAVGRLSNADILAAAPDHAEGIGSAHAAEANAAFFAHRARQSGLRRMAERGQVGVEICLRIVVTRQGMLLAGLLVKPWPGFLAQLVIASTPMAAETLAD